MCWLIGGENVWHIAHQEDPIFESRLRQCVGCVALAPLFPVFNSFTYVVTTTEQKYYVCNNFSSPLQCKTGGQFFRLYDSILLCVL